MTIRHYIEKLPKEVQEKIYANPNLLNLDVEFPMNVEEKHRPSASISAAFEWDGTTEGREYWTSISNKIYLEENASWK